MHKITENAGSTKKQEAQLPQTVRDADVRAHSLSL